MNGEWIGVGKVRAREADGVLELVVDGLTTQAKYYKPLIYEFFRKEWRGARPAWGDHSVEIDMDYVGEAPWLDLDNLAKAILDAINKLYTADFRHSLQTMVNPYGDGGASQKIVQVLRDENLDDILKKSFYDLNASVVLSCRDHEPATPSCLKAT